MNAEAKRFANLALIPADARLACFILTATKGHRRAARRLVTEEIKRVVGKRWMPRCYVSAEEMRAYSVDGIGCEPRITIDLTDDEFSRIGTAISDRAAAEGWSGAPIDSYHD